MLKILQDEVKHEKNFQTLLEDIEKIGGKK